MPTFSNLTFKNHTMSEFIVITRDGESHTVEAQNGRSLMELIRDAGLDELEAMCGGSCSCATCHVYIDADSQASMVAINDGEEDLLDGSEFRSDESRLSCQVIFTQAMQGIQVKIAPEG
ncbi:MAG: 2Fe-2S ferredoxin [Zhongshania sp.]